MSRLLALAAVVALVALPAAPRDTEGRLDTILTPNGTRPVFVVPGARFEVSLRSEAELELASPQGRFPLDTVFTHPPNGLVRGVCQLPKDILPGTYALEAQSQGRVDRVFRAVYVLDRFPGAYRLGHLSNLRASAHEGPDTVAVKNIQVLNDAGVSLVLVTGDLTADGRPEQFASALKLLGRCTAPTFVCPGEADIARGHATDFLGPMPFAFRFGADGYLSMRLGGVGSQDLDGAIGKAHRLRRAIRGARWSIGFTAHFDLDAPLREQLTLFRDDPLDWLMTATGPPADADGRFAIPWDSTVGTTGIVAASTRRAELRILEVGPAGLVPDPTKK